MDILISSNLERLLYDVSGADPDAVSDLMAQLKNQGAYQASKTLMEKTRLFYAGAADEAETAQAIKAIFDESHYLMDPHTAVANKVYEDYLNETGDATKTVIVSTASPYKFGRSVYESIFGACDCNDYELLNILAEKTGTAIPQPLKDLDKKANQHQVQCDKTEMSQAVLDFLKDQVDKND
jgi:threonine synthase